MGAAGKRRTGTDAGGSRPSSGFTPAGVYLRRWQPHRMPEPPADYGKARVVSLSPAYRVRLGDLRRGAGGFWGPGGWRVPRPPNPPDRTIRRWGRWRCEIATSELL